MSERFSPGFSPQAESGAGQASSLPPFASAGILEIVAAPLLAIAERLRQALLPAAPHRALLIFTEDCVGRPQKKAGAQEIIEHVTILELEEIRARLRRGERVEEAVLGGQHRPVRVWEAATGSLLVLADPGEISVAAEEHVVAVWEIAALRIRQQVAEPAPGALVESHAVASERLRIATELTERHATDLESLQAILRSRNLDDTSARRAAVEVVATALVRTRTASDVLISVSEEPVRGAFARLRTDLRPLTQYGRLDVQFVEPPVDGRALPGEIAHAARAIVRGTILTMNDQEDIARVRVQWDCDGTNLLIDIRDDGHGAVDADAPGIRQARATATALGGRVELVTTPGWGTQLDVRLPLDAPRPLGAQEWGLAAREGEVLRLLAQGLRNRQIAHELVISENTVKFHITRIYRKLGVNSRSAAVAAAVAHGFG